MPEQFLSYTFILAAVYLNCFWKHHQVISVTCKPALPTFTFSWLIIILSASVFCINMWVRLLYLLLCQLKYILQNLQCQLFPLSDFKVTIYVERLLNVHFKENSLCRKALSFFLINTIWVMLGSTSHLVNGEVFLRVVVVLFWLSFFFFFLQPI